MYDLVGQKGDPGLPGHSGMKLLNSYIHVYIYIYMSQMNNNHIGKY